MLKRATRAARGGFIRKQVRFGGVSPGCDAGMYGTPIDTREPHYLDFDDEPDFPRSGKIVVFGGTGFVGQEVCRIAACRGYDVISISRSGTRPFHTTEAHYRFRAPDNYNYIWADKVQWMKGDAADPASYSHLLKQDDPKKPFLGVVSCVGAFGSAVKVNGTTNATLVDACKKAGSPRFCYISAAIFPPPFKWVLGSYYRGKKIAEEAVTKHYPETGLSIRAGGVIGMRWLFGTVPCSTWLLMVIPRILSNFARQWWMKPLKLDKIFIKPIHLDHLGSAACNFLERPNIRFKGVIEEYDDIRLLGRSFGNYYEFEWKWHIIR